MTLKEKLDTLKKYDEQDPHETFMTIADDYVIEFGVWLSTTCQQGASKDGFWIYENRWKTINELLEIFKKEKGL